MTRNFGRYKVAEELGRGAMGVVYRAVDPVIGRTVAIKAINHQYLESVGVRGEEYQARFEREAQVAGGLDHPAIVKIYDLGPDYLVMEHVEGQTLAARLRQDGPLDRETTLRVVHETAAALDYAHGLGVVHRDVKPANVMLTRDGAVKVMDFGLARIESSTLTAAGEILGSAAYMAPEVIQGQAADARSDNFALAVLAYELLTGERPFGGATVSAIIHNVVRSQPRSPRELNGQLPPEYDAIFARAFAKDPGERYSRALDFAEALASCAWNASPVAGDATVRLTAPVAAPAAPQEDPGGETVMTVDADEVGGGEAEAPPPTAATVIMASGPPAAPAEPELAATIMMKPSAPPAAPAPPEADTSATVVSAPPAPAAPAEPEVAATIMMKPSAPPAAPAPPEADTSATVVSGAPPPTQPPAGATVVMKPSGPPGASTPAQAPPAPAKAAATAPPKAPTPPVAPRPGPPKPPAPPAAAPRPPASPARSEPPAPPGRRGGGGLMMVLGLGFGIVALFAVGVLASWLFVRSQTRVPAPAAPPSPVAEATPEVPPTTPEASEPEPEPVAEATPEAPVAPAAPSEGTLSIESTPPGASVSIKGRKRGSTPLRLKVPAGSVSLRLEKEGYKPWSQDLRVRAGESRTLRAQLESAATPPPAVATPPPAPKAPAVREGDLVLLGPDVKAPRRVKGDSPKARRNFSGSVLVEFTVGIDGKPEDIKIVESGGTMLDDAVLRAVRTYRYEPATSHGVKVRVQQRARFKFE